MAVNLAGYRMVTSDIGFIDIDKYEKEMKIFDYDHRAARVSVDVCAYSDSEKLEKDFNFHANGFQFCRLEESNSLSSALRDYRERSDSVTAKFGVQFAVEDFLRSWGPKNGIQGAVFLSQNSLYRSSHSSHQTYLAGPLRFAHVDFTRDRLVNPATSEGSAHYDLVKYKYNINSDESYKKLVNTSKTVWVKVWIPLNEKPSADTLGLVDTSSVPELEQQLQPITFDGWISSRSVYPTSNQKWVAKEGLTLEDRVVIVFDSTRAIHAGLVIKESSHQGHRESLEFTGMFVTPPEEK